MISHPNILKVKEGFHFTYEIHCVCRPEVCRRTRDFIKRKVKDDKKKRLGEKNTNVRQTKY